MNSNISEDWLNKLYEHFNPTKRKRTMSESQRSLLDEDGIWELHMRGLSNREIARLISKPSRTIDRRIKYLADLKAGKETKKLRDY